MGILISMEECWRPDLSKILGLQVEVVHDRGRDPRQFKSRVNGERERDYSPQGSGGRNEQSWWEDSKERSECRIERVFYFWLQ